MTGVIDRNIANLEAALENATTNEERAEIQVLLDEQRRAKGGFEDKMLAGDPVLEEEEGSFWDFLPFVGKAQGGRIGYQTGGGGVMDEKNIRLMHALSELTPGGIMSMMNRGGKSFAEWASSEKGSEYLKKLAKAYAATAYTLGTPKGMMDMGIRGAKALTENRARGGRIGFQTGGTTVSQQLQPDYIEALGKTYAADLTRQAGIPAITQATQQMPGETASQFQQRQAQAQQFDITQQSMGLLAPQVAAQDPMQAAAYTQATDPTYGLGAYQPYTADARAAAQAATGLTGPMTGAQLATIDPTTGQTVTPTLAPGSYMSPYQQQVIDATKADYDAQAAKSRLGLGAQAVSGGAFGSGRHGIAEAEFDALSNRGRASMLADLRQRGFQQAQAGRQQDFVNQQALATQQAGLGTQALGNVQRQIAGLGTLGATQQAQNQAVLDAQRQFASMAVNEPQQRLGMLGQGVTGLMGGMQGVGTTLGQAPPQTSPLGTALGIGSTLAGIYGYMNR